MIVCSEPVHLKSEIDPSQQAVSYQLFCQKTRSSSDKQLPVMQLPVILVHSRNWASYMLGERYLASRKLTLSEPSAMLGKPVLLEELSATC